MHKTYKRTCDQCGENYEGPGKKYCSVRCKRVRDIAVASKKNKGFCQQCNKYYEGFGVKFCSIACQRASGVGRRGIKFSLESREKMSKSRKGRCIGAESPCWKGGKYLSAGGYVMVNAPQHPRVNKKPYVQEHILVAEKAMGKYLPKNAEVHHINMKRADNNNSNLVVCQDSAYHNLIHQRMRSKLESGDANKKKCWICKQYDDPDKVQHKKKSYHRQCNIEYNKKMRIARREAVTAYSSNHNSI